MSPEDRARRAKELLEDPVLKDILAEIERQATWQMAADYHWWWGERRVRLALEHLRGIKSFHDRLLETLTRITAEQQAEQQRRRRYVA